ncbi:hypothetical protein GDO81_024387 [Engystomops pustulosus]|uniref:Uncharacterized protein n=1 Tax=Engystomops pustulosus TaxID=76066 RepID=A0AAV6Z5T8_ENGPU|nr:hypothetical protein GDO81_024387 [Engystomops pustulosus]
MYSVPGLGSRVVVMSGGWEFTLRAPDTRGQVPSSIYSDTTLWRPLPALRKKPNLTGRAQEKLLRGHLHPASGCIEDGCLSGSCLHPVENSVMVQLSKLVCLESSGRCHLQPRTAHLKPSDMSRSCSVVCVETLHVT